MDWKLVLKTAGITGVLAIPIQLLGIYLDAMNFYGIVLTWQVIIFIAFSIVFIGLVFNFVYQKTTKFRIWQSVITIFLGSILSFVFAILGLIIFVKFFP